MNSHVFSFLAYPVPPPPSNSPVSIYSSPGKEDVDPEPPTSSNTQRTFVVECENNKCPLVVHGVLLPNRAEVRHSTAGDCPCEGPDRALVCTWMWWMAHMCMNHGLITEEQANAIVDLTRKDLHLDNAWVTFFGEEGMQKTEEKDEWVVVEREEEGDETAVEEDAEVEEVNPAVIDADMFRAVQAVTKGYWSTKIIRVEDILE